MSTQRVAAKCMYCKEDISKARSAIKVQDATGVRFVHVDCFKNGNRCIVTTGKGDQNITGLPF